MKAVLIAVGDELTSGQVPDTNSAYLAEQLGSLGIEVCEHRTVRDRRRSIAEAIRAAAGCAQVVLVTGGLGPTPDDVTREALADAMGAELAIHRQSLAEIQEFFHRRGRKMARANRAQAMIPVGAEAMANRAGTAPGVAGKVGDALVLAMPGVPHEMKRMFEQQVAPRLPKGGRAILVKNIHTFGMGESDLSELISDLTPQDPDITIGTTVSAGLVTVKITAGARDAADCLNRIEPISGQLRRKLGDVVVGEDQDTMASVVGALLRRAEQTVATAESCTGGLIAKMISDVSGASAYYLGGLVAYSNEAKRDLLGVGQDLLDRHGAVSQQVAAAMAGACRERFSSDWALSLTGIAGPTGGSEEKPVGLVYIGLCGRGDTAVHRHIFPGTRGHIRRRASLAALNHLRLALPAKPPGE